MIRIQKTLLEGNGHYYMFSITFVSTKNKKLHLWTVQQKNRIEINTLWYAHVVFAMTFYDSVILCKGIVGTYYDILLYNIR